MNVVEFKIKLLQHFLGAKAMTIVPPPTEVEHKYRRLPGEQRFRCAYCSLQGKKSRTRYICAADCCQVPLCKFTEKEKEGQKDCFFWAHSNEECLRLTKIRFADMQKSVTKKNNSAKKSTNQKKRRRN